VAKYSNMGLKCAFLGQNNPVVNEGVVNGAYKIIYTTLETFLNVLKWREVFRSTYYQTNLIGIVVDEAHCIEQW
jgi:ATP-dependent DNA helicase RecQ